MLLKNATIAGALVGLMGSAAFAAECGPEGQSIRVLGSDFPAIQAVTATAEANCGGAANEFTITLRDDTRDMMNQAQTPNPAQYTSVIVANSTLTQQMNDGLVRPLDDLIEKYGASLKPNQLITVDGKVMAVAFMANSQHLYARSDILEQAGVDGIPATVEEVVAAAEKIRAAGIMEHPIVMNASGWNMGELFNLFYFAHGGELFKPGTADPNVNNETGVAALNSIKSLTEYAHPDYLSHASNETQGLWEAGQAALGIMWGSRGGDILDDQGSSPEVTGSTVLASAPTVAGGSIPAATLWWDGITIAQNISDEEAEATFAALAGALTADMVAEHNDDAIWLIEGFKPGPAAEGVAATAQGGAKIYPMIPYINLMHNAASAELADFLKGDETAEQTLADIEAAYVTSAKEAGFLQ
ncbi:ABC transporter substrate-binding protein [Tropicimonas marinistellae]|uniref:ABC transporter substrate-binding protein n=1 Tax=Tropicimonas marinistellae TaxID=1739787 RepID=UPI00082FB512|nr:extracellular solute-binding protein [Tropicimonas marinistellae]